MLELPLGFSFLKDLLNKSKYVFAPLGRRGWGDLPPVSLSRHPPRDDRGPYSPATTRGAPTSVGSEDLALPEVPTEPPFV